MHNNKNQLRKIFLNKRKALVSDVINIQLNNILFNFLKQNYSDSSIGCYYPLINETNILPTIEKLFLYSTLSLPCIKEHMITFHSYSKSTQLVSNKYNILEPLNSKIVYPKIILTPLIAIDLHGNRLGYGKGYYDRYFTLNKGKLIKIGICFQAQITETLPTESHDIPLDLIITEQNIYYCR